MEPKTKEELDQQIELIAKFMGYEKVRIGYWCCPEDEDGETEWQKNNRVWIDKVGIESVGVYFVNVPNDEWIYEDGMNYNQDWNKLMECWYKFLGLRFKEPMPQFKHSEIKTTVGYAILYGDIKLAYDNLVEAIKWYNTTKQ